jgi:hypothetical protein
MDFRLVVKPLGITIMKESGKAVETSEEGDVVKPHAKEEIQKAGNSPHG